MNIMQMVLAKRTPSDNRVYMNSNLIHSELDAYSDE